MFYDFIIGVAIGLMILMYARYIRNRITELQDRIGILEHHAKRNYEKLENDFKAINKLNEAVMAPDSFHDMYSLMNTVMLKQIYGVKPEKKEPTRISILEDKFEAALGIMGVEVKKQYATDEKFIATKKTVKRSKNVKK